MHIDSLWSKILWLSSKANHSLSQARKYIFYDIVTLLQSVNCSFFFPHRTHPRRRVVRVVRQRARRTNHNNKELVSSVCDTVIRYLRAIIHELVFVSMLQYFVFFLFFIFYINHGKLCARLTYVHVLHYVDIFIRKHTFLKKRLKKKKTKSLSSVIFVKTYLRILYAVKIKRRIIFL